MSDDFTCFRRRLILALYSTLAIEIFLLLGQILLSILSSNSSNELILNCF